MNLEQAWIMKSLLQSHGQHRKALHHRPTADNQKAGSGHQLHQSDACSTSCSHLYEGLKYFGGMEEKLFGTISKSWINALCRGGQSREARIIG